MPASSMPCPHCGEFGLYRSRSQNVREKILRKLTRFKLYRCRQCKWRGWLRKPRYANKKDLYRDLVFYAVPILIGVLIFLWLMRTRPL